MQRSLHAPRTCLPGSGTISTGSTIQAALHPRPAMQNTIRTLGRSSLRGYRSAVLLLGAVTLAGLSLLPRTAQAQSIIKQPGNHPTYSFEAEPHLAIMDHWGHGGDGVGPGFRGTITVVDNGFVSKINNSVGIGFGLDALIFNNDDHCHGGGNDRYCHGDNTQLFLPIVMQWNFWLHRKWSVFGEPGLAITLRDEDHNRDNDDTDLDIDPLVLFAGGRFHFNDTAALTLRLGFPTSVSFGVSFLL